LKRDSVIFVSALIIGLFLVSIAFYPVATHDQFGNPITPPLILFDPFGYVFLFFGSLSILYSFLYKKEHSIPYGGG